MFWLGFAVGVGCSALVLVLYACLVMSGRQNDWAYIAHLERLLGDGFDAIGRFLMGRA